jgi:outer membrane immunogenic protein
MGLLGMKKTRGRRAVRVSLVNRLHVLAIAVVAAGAVDVSSVALAADMPVKARPLPPPARSWDGCYAGGQLGGADSRSTWRYDGLNPYNSADGVVGSGVTEETFQQLKAAVGAQVGCNFSYSGPWMLGLEAGLIATPMDRTQDTPVRNAATGFLGSVRTEIRSIFSATGRVGFSPTQDWLIYAKGGYAAAYIELSGSIGDFATLNWSDANWHHGWTVGGGFEYRLFRNVSVGAEYAYYQFGERNYFSALSGATPDNWMRLRAGAEVHTAMARINFYHPDSAAAKTAANYSSPAFPGRFSSFVNTGAQYGAWEGSRGPNVFQPDKGKGYQVYSPVSMGIDYDTQAYKIETRAKGGYVYTAQRTDGQTAYYSGPIDTQTSLNVVLLTFESVRPQFGVAMNLPTGTSYLPNNQRFTRIDPDLAMVGSYGAGFNINPTAGFVVGLNQSTAISLSAGYAWQGKFVREAISLDTAFAGVFNLKQYINPGDVVTANFNVTTEVGNTVIYGSFAYMSESAVEINGIESGRAGARYNSNLTLNTQLTDRWSIVTNGSWNFSEKNEIIVGGSLVTEPKNSNSHVVIASVEPDREPVHSGEDQAHRRSVGPLCRDRDLGHRGPRRLLLDRAGSERDPAGHRRAADICCNTAPIELYCVDGFHRSQFPVLGHDSDAQHIDPDLEFHRRAADLRWCGERAIAHADRRGPAAAVPEGARRLLRQDRDRRSHAPARRDHSVGAGVVLRHAAGQHRRAVHPVRAVLPGQRRAVRAADGGVRGVPDFAVEVGSPASI